ncbi:ABC transporter permease [Lysobacter sp. CA199]|uniref:ABC transporter permease n=1 Tax=Lysobacter sp. CA199 TaxID=3455608 RepID=UPI003F8D30AF
MTPTAPRTVAAFPPQRTFKMLLKREFWEHRGGFLWGPLIAGAIAIGFALIGVIAGSVLFHNVAARSSDGVSVDLSGNSEKIGGIGDMALAGGLGLVFTVYVFVVFFYALGSIYDERKDRSILFWKSLPVSDAQAVLSKLLWALVLAPVMTAVIGLGVGLVMWVLAWLAALLNGVDGASAIFTQAHPLQLVAEIVLAIPVYALWALPTVGWLMLCSAWVRSVPFVWAVVIPLLACVFVSFLDIMPGIDIPHGAIWYVIGLRGLLSVVPGTWFLNEQVAASAKDAAMTGPQALTQSIDVTSSLHALTTLDLWVGAVIGAAMVYGAIRLRRWRDEG